MTTIRISGYILAALAAMLGVITHNWFFLATGLSLMVLWELSDIKDAVRGRK